MTNLIGSDREEHINDYRHRFISKYQGMYNLLVFISNGILVLCFTVSNYTVLAYRRSGLGSFTASQIIHLTHSPLTLRLALLHVENV